MFNLTFVLVTKTSIEKKKKKKKKKHFNTPYQIFLHLNVTRP